MKLSKGSLTALVTTAHLTPPGQGVQEVEDPESGLAAVELRVPETRGVRHLHSIH